MALKDARRDLRAVDAFCVVYLLLLTVIAALAAGRVPQWAAIIAINTAAAGLVLLCRRLSLHSAAAWRRFAFGAFPLLLFTWLWAEIGMLQHVLHPGWCDGAIIRLEHAVFGVDLSLWAERFISKPVTEWMMFGYFGYLPAIPVLAVVLFFRVRPRAMDTYLFAVALGYATCFLVFILLPVAGPKHAFPEAYTRELNGYVFRWLTRLMEDYGHFPGGSFPSPHSTAGTVMLFMAFKHHRPTFYAILPVIGTFYLATVYGRYHYVSDTITGVLLGLAVGWAAPRLEALWQCEPGPSLGTSRGR